MTTNYARHIRTGEYLFFNDFDVPTLDEHWVVYRPRKSLARCRRVGEHLHDWMARQVDELTVSDFWRERARKVLEAPTSNAKDVEFLVGALRGWGFTSIPETIDVVEGDSE